MAFILKKIQATTLVETLVSLTIISFIAGVAILIFWQVSSPGSSARSMLYAQQKSGEMMDAVSASKDTLGIVSRERAIRELVFEQQVVQLEPKLTQVIIAVRDNSNKVIYTRKKLFYVKGE